MAWIVKGAGNTEFRGANSCRVEFQTQNTATGEIRRERKTFQVSARTKKERERCKREFRAELESGLDRSERFTTFAEYAEEWIKAREASADVAPRTVSKERNRIRTINISMGNMRLREITRRDVRNFQTALMTTGKDGKAPTISGRPLSGTTANGVRATLRQILQDALRDEIILKNPCDDLKAPKCDTQEKDPLTADEAARFRALLDAATPRPSLVAFRLCLFAGLRRGEVCGLTWSDYNASAAEITISRSLCSETLEFKDTKTKAGARTIPLDAGTVAYLNAYKAIQAEKLLALGKPVESACIVAKASTSYLHPENLTRSLRRFGDANGFAGVTPHVLRHTYCTLLFATGTDLKTVQYLMGHDDPGTTLRIYTHYTKNNGIKAAAAVDRLMESLPTDNVIPFDRPQGRWGIRGIAV